MKLEEYGYEVRFKLPADASKQDEGKVCKRIEAFAKQLNRDLRRDHGHTWKQWELEHDPLGRAGTIRIKDGPDLARVNGLSTVEEHLGMTDELRNKIAVELVKRWNSPKVVAAGHIDTLNM